MLLKSVVLYVSREAPCSRIYRLVTVPSRIFRTQALGRECLRAGIHDILRVAGCLTVITHCHLSPSAHSISIFQSVLVPLIGAALLAVGTRCFRWTQCYAHCRIERKTPYICPSPSMRVLFKLVEAALSNILPEQCK